MVTWTTSHQRSPRSISASRPSRSITVIWKSDILTRPHPVQRKYPPIWSVLHARSNCSADCCAARHDESHLVYRPHPPVSDHQRRSWSVFTGQKLSNSTAKTSSVRGIARSAAGPSLNPCLDFYLQSRRRPPITTSWWRCNWQNLDNTMLFGMSTIYRKPTMTILCPVWWCGQRRTRRLSSIQRHPGPIPRASERSRRRCSPSRLCINFNTGSSHAITAFIAVSEAEARCGSPFP